MLQYLDCTQNAVRLELCHCNLLVYQVAVGSNISHSYSALHFCENNHRLYINKWTWLCSNKTLFVDTRIWTSNHFVSWNSIVLIFFSAVWTIVRCAKQVVSQFWSMGSTWPSLLYSVNKDISRQPVVQITACLHGVPWWLKEHRANNSWDGQISEAPWIWDF